MELSAGSDWEVVVSEYKIPLQKLARRWKGSVQLWKGKYPEASIRSNPSAHNTSVRRSNPNANGPTQQTKTRMSTQNSQPEVFVVPA